MSDECLELKSIKYKSMLLNGHNEQKEETVENMKNMEGFLENEKQSTLFEPWIKLNKTKKLVKFKEYVNNYSKENELNENQKNELYEFLISNLERKRLTKAKEVVYSKEQGKIINIPSIILNPATKKFTLKRNDKRPSTLKSLAPKKTKNKKSEKDKT